ncbi:DUF3341 domain-containing protein [Flammeovirgaceae bacterium SG7u.111]|nr:DUF3341 domain-containing protein [Flammeovirgaceae bacterium SG7u.132]WPO36673.1 DUF3341 domain-containing protein [Flammeovirgaceae bacterium SG7u.111]
MEINKHFLVGIFDDQDVLLSAVKNIRAKGIKIYEVYNPYPVHHLEDALGYKRSKMPVAAFFFGMLGTTLAILMQTLMMGVDWSMIIGGKPFIAVPAFVPVTFELTVLLSAYGMGFTFFGTQKLYPHKVPRIFDRRSSDDKHVMAIDLGKNSMSEAEIKAALTDVKAEEVYRKDFTDEENDPNFINYAVDLFTNGVTSSSRKLAND